MDKISSQELIYHETRELWSYHNHIKEILDSKASTQLGFTGIIMTIHVSLIPLIISESSIQNSAAFPIWLTVFILTSIFFIFSAFLSVLAFRVQKYKVGPSVVELCTDKETEKNEILNKLIDTYKRQIDITDSESNSKKNKEKALFIEFSTYFLLLGIVLLSFSSITLIFGGII